MPKDNIPTEWDLSSHRRYKRQNMERAMRGKIERGLVELITNSDDSYRNLEDKGIKVSGKIRIEIERKKANPTVVIVRDRAEGMNKLEMYNKLGELGGRTSGFEAGKLRRGLHGRGARDIVAFGTVHFESIKDREYNNLIIPPSLKCRFSSPCKKVGEEIRKDLGILRGNGTVVTIEVGNRFKIPLHETFVTDFSQYYSIRDILSNPSRNVTIIDLNKKREDPLVFHYTEGEVVFEQEISIPYYPDAKVYLNIIKHFKPFEQKTLPYKEGGILVKSSAAIHDCTYFELESEPFAWRFSGELRCKFIDNLIKEYDDREDENPDNPNHPENNPMRLLDPFRDGLILEHPFTQALYKECKQILKPIIDELKTSEEPHKRNVTDENLQKKLKNLSKEISKVFEKKVKEFEEEIPPGPIDEGKIKELSIGLHIIPPDEQPIIINQPKTFSVIVKHYEILDNTIPVNVICHDPDNVKVISSQIFIQQVLEDGTVGRTTFTVKGLKLGTEAYIEVRYSGYDNLLLVKIVEQPLLQEIPKGLSFEKPKYHVKINKEKSALLQLKTKKKLSSPIIANITSENPEIIIKGGGKCKIHETEITGILFGKCRFLGRQLNAKGNISAIVEGFEPAITRVMVEERTPVSGADFKIEPVEEDFGSLRYKWESPYLLLIGAKHPSIRRYLGNLIGEQYKGIDSPLYHSVLAEVVAEALAFRILEIQFKKDGQEGMLDYASTDTYFHKHFSEFLNIAHKVLVSENIKE